MGEMVKITAILHIKNPEEHNITCPFCGKEKFTLEILRYATRDINCPCCRALIKEVV